MLLGAQCLISTMQSISLIVLVISGVLSDMRNQKNNVCPTFEDYFTIENNPRCWFDIAAASDVVTIIQSRGYPVEVHKVITEDGYILTMHRIPNTRHPRRKRYPIFLQHGLIATSANFATQSRNVSMAFILSDAGYDIWMGNYRGTTYSQEHVRLTVRDNEYWNHSLDHLGLMDIPAMLNKIAEVTGKKGETIVIGHSLGTTISMIYASARPEEARRNIKFMVLLAPAATLTNMISPFRILAPLSEAILDVVVSNDLIRVVSSPNISNLYSRTLCLDSPIVLKRCEQIFNIFYGPYSQMGAELLPVFFWHLPAGTSVKVIRHAADLVLGKFHMYDNGAKINERIYGSKSPPVYNTKNIRVPTLIMYAVNDWACGKKDALVLASHMSPEVLPFGIAEIDIKDFNHMDFLYGSGVKKIVTDRLMRLFDTLHKLPIKRTQNVPIL
ncbi:lipase 3-like [Agrilus planipennis]|uniref:Lipase 3-like n=1 Tax=Agrilus planipennis TaxID=224129 RepID=A0A7F5R705_AGRPL|nr:lipase 3-like [Agrilus planipennis]